MTSQSYAPHGRAGGIIAVAFILLTAFYGAVFIYGPLLPLLFIWPWLFRRIAEVSASTWQAVLVFIYEKFHKMKVVVRGDSIDRHEKTVVLLNHRTRLDWMYFFPVVFHSLILNRQKISLKSMLKWPPGIGWAMQVAAYIFLDRNWEKDKSHIGNILSYFVELGSKPNILFFPEGTDLSDSNKIKSQAYARKNGLTEFEYVLQPKTKGFTSFVTTLRQVSGIQAVHDVTIAYPYNIPISEADLLRGEIPKEVHFHIKRHSIDELPEDEEKLARWCIERWEEKEKMLRQYYSETDSSKRSFKSDKIPPHHPRSLGLWLAMLGWLALSIFFTYLLITSSGARYFALAMTSFYIGETLYFGDFVKMEMYFYALIRKSREKWGQKGK